MIRRLAAALALVAMGISMPVAPAHAARWADGPCNDNVGITIVIDFQELGGGVNVRCAPGAVSSGLDALDQAGVAWEGVRRFPGFLCRIAGLPGPDAESCNNTPPATAFWSYWLAPRGGAWCFSTTGPGNRVPPPGTVEGWSFALNRNGADIPPPGLDPPAAIAGQTPNPLSPADCSTPTAPVPTSTSSPAPTTVAAAVSVSPTTAASTADPVSVSTAVAEHPVDQASETPKASTAAAQTGANTGAASSTTAGPSTTTSTGGSTTTRPSTTSTTANRETVSNATADSALTGSAVAQGTVDLSDDGRGGSDFSAASGLGLVTAAGVGGGSIWYARRRRAVP